MKRLIIVTLALTCLASGCSTTKQLDHWQSEALSRKQLDNLLIVAVTNNRTHRFIFESELDLRARESGLTSVTSQKVLGDSIPTEEEVAAYVKQNNIDYVIATRLANTEVDKEYVPERVRNYYVGPYYPSYGHYYDAGNVITTVRDPYVDLKTTYILVTTIFDAKTGEPVWVGRSATFEPGSIQAIADDIARTTWRNIAR